MSDEQIIVILWRDGYHCAAQRMEELVNFEKKVKEFPALMEEVASKMRRYMEVVNKES